MDLKDKAEGLFQHWQSLLDQNVQLIGIIADSKEKIHELAVEVATPVTGQIVPEDLAVIDTAKAEAEEARKAAGVAIATAEEMKTQMAALFKEV